MTFQALTAFAKWVPRAGYAVSPEESKSSLGRVGSMVWKDPVFRFVDTPVPTLSDDEVLIRVHRCGVCGSDTHVYETDASGYILFSGPVRLPCVVGHEYSGVVEAVGGAVKSVKPGALVAAESVLWCGRCLACRSGAVNQCENVELAGLTAPGAMARYAKAKEWHVWNIDSIKERHGLDKALDMGALIEPVGCAFNGLFVAGGGFMPGAAVAVFGLGPIGLSAVALAKIAGASVTLGFDVVQERLEIAAGLGADIVKLSGGCDPVQEIMAATGGRGAEVMVEAAGAGNATVPVMEKAMSRNGKLIYLGRAAQSVPLDANRLVTGAGAFIGARGHSGYGIFGSIIKLMAAGKLDVARMITSRFPFDKSLEAIKASTSRKDGKIMVEI
ncbi:MAG: alcohol dehydrogenase catalytic domain-containing protein [Nitrospinae bacterium]|nr:alcohol dehydrogenase catalytic domain-containing protein [Nitrospinota bacterium]